MPIGSNKCSLLHVPSCSKHKKRTRLTSPILLFFAVINTYWYSRTNKYSCNKKFPIPNHYWIQVNNPILQIFIESTLVWCLYKAYSLLFYLLISLCKFTETSWYDHQFLLVFLHKNIKIMHWDKLLCEYTLDKP